MLAKVLTKKLPSRCAQRDGFCWQRTWDLFASSLLLPLLWLAVLPPISLPAQTLQLDPSKILNQAPPQAAAAAPAVPLEKIHQGYVYVEPNQVRFEVLLDVSTMLAWAKMPPEPSLDTSRQKALSEAVSAKAADWCRMGTRAVQTGRFLGASIIRGKPGATVPFEEGETLPLAESMVGLAWEFPLPPSPDEILLEWTGYLDGQSRLPIQVFYGGKSPEKLEAVPEIKVLRWRSHGRLPSPIPLAKVPEISTRPPWKVPVAGLVWFLGGLVFLVWTLGRGHRLPGGTVAFLGAWAMGCLLSSPFFVVKVSRDGSVPAVTDPAVGQEILSPLLKNVYRAFDFREESDIYDTLARSVDGELLRKLYLETLQALTLEGREGTRVTVTEFSLETQAVRPSPAGDGFVADCQWTVLGTVGHWGHSHTRVNRYTAEVTVVPVNREWKVVRLEVREARRI